MADITPTQLFANYTLAANGDTITADSIVIPLSDLTGLTTTEADPATGDGREVVRILLESIFNSLNSLQTNERPTRLIFSKSQNLPGNVGVNQIRQNYNFSFDVSFLPGNVDLVAEN